MENLVHSEAEVFAKELQISRHEEASPSSWFYLKRNRPTVPNVKPFIADKEMSRLEALFRTILILIF
jgi:hypothetical protein